MHQLYADDCTHYSKSFSASRYISTMCAYQTTTTHHLPDAALETGQVICTLVYTIVNWHATITQESKNTYNKSWLLNIPSSLVWASKTVSSSLILSVRYWTAVLSCKGRMFMCRKALPKRYRMRSSIDSQAGDITEVRLVATVLALQDVIMYEGTG